MWDSILDTVVICSNNLHLLTIFIQTTKAINYLRVIYDNNKHAKRQASSSR